MPGGVVGRLCLHSQNPEAWSCWWRGVSGADLVPVELGSRSFATAPRAAWDSVLREFVHMFTSGVKLISSFLFYRNGRIGTNNKDKPVSVMIQFSIEKPSFRTCAWCCAWVSPAVFLCRPRAASLCSLSFVFAQVALHSCVFFLCIIVL